MSERRAFVYFESTEGGMETMFVTDASDLGRLYNWMGHNCRKEDESLVEWMSTAEIGDYRFHRLGVCVRVRVGWGEAKQDGAA